MGQQPKTNTDIEHLGWQGAKEIFSAVYTEALSLVASPAANLLSNGTKLKVLKPFFQTPKYVRKERLRNLYYMDEILCIQNTF